jgi:hypothetical protein
MHMGVSSNILIRQQLPVNPGGSWKETHAVQNGQEVILYASISENGS